METILEEQEDKINKQNLVIKFLWCSVMFMSINYMFYIRMCSVTLGVYSYACSTEKGEKVVEIWHML